jgi:hypothetical protein
MKMQIAKQRRRIMVTVPDDVHQWTAERARYHGSTLSAELVRSVRERMEREAAAAKDRVRATAAPK